jgi:hypothetical protein
MTRTLELQIRVPDSASDEAIQAAGRRAREAAIASLQQEGALTIREAAAELGLTYDEYLRMLDGLGLPASHDGTSPEAMALLRRKVGGGQKMQ